REARRIAVDRSDDVSEHDIERIPGERVEEVADREIGRNAVVARVRDDNLDVFTPVLVRPCCHCRASHLGEGGRDLDPDDLAERPLGRLVYDATLPAAEVDERVLGRDSDVAGARWSG